MKSTPVKNLLAELLICEPEMITSDIQAFGEKAMYVRCETLTWGNFLVCTLTS
jgi:hypothetical protein